MNTTAATSSTQAGDPFFSLTNDGEWNACIGRQGTEENYVDGYMEAALELASAVIDKRQYEKRDTLVMPILYNARHAVELSLKFVIGRLCEAGVIGTPRRMDHDIKSYWTLIASAPLGDADLRKHTSDLKPFVESLHGIDEKNEQFRYAKTQDGQKSLEDKARCNLELVRESLLLLKETLVAMKCRAVELVAERATGTFTTDCSRRDLGRIAKMLPPLEQWSEPVFTKAKNEAMARFAISSRKFSQAVEVIKGHREMGGLVGYEFKLTYLTDEHARFVIEEWSKAHPSRAADDSEMDQSRCNWDKSRTYFQIKMQQAQLRAAVEKSVLDTLSPEEVADLDTIYHIGRGCEPLFSEVYDERLETTLKEHRLAGGLAGEVHHLMTKVDLLDALARGIEILGRRRLAAELRLLRPGLTAP